MNKFEKIGLFLAFFILFLCILILLFYSYPHEKHKPRYPVLQDISILEKIRNNELRYIYTEENERLYNIELNSIWSSKTHPNWAPLNPTILPFIAWSHNKKIDIFKLGQKSSVGFEKYIETGNTKLLINEIIGWKKESKIHSYTKGSLIFSPAVALNVLKVTKKHPHLTFVAPLSPSPDWFMAVTDIHLYSKENGWIDKVILPVRLYDAGSDDGINFYSTDINSNFSSGIQYLTIPSNTPLAYLTITNAK